MGRAAVGVRAIRLRDGDWCVAAVRADPESDLLTVTENGYGKRTDMGEYSVQGRGGMGLKNYNITDKTGCVAAAKKVRGTEDVILVSDDGTIIRLGVEDISRLGRATQGVRLMRPAAGARVVSMAKAHREEEISETELPGEGLTGPEGEPEEA